MTVSKTRSVRFQAPGPFQADLKQRVDAFFERTGRNPRGGWRLHLQTAIMFAWLGASYGLLMFTDVNAWQAVLLAISTGLAVAGIGFNVMHDANHGSYSHSRRVNRLMRCSLDLIGGSSYLWRHKHNVLHHTYTNIEGLDTDGDAGILLRLAPSQRWYRFHRLQHVYAWVLYALFALKWWFADDFRELITGHIGGNPFPRPKRIQVIGALAGKALFLGWAFVLPAILHPTWWLVPLWLIAAATVGLVLATVFQLAHCVSEATHLDADATPTMDVEWAVHQVTTTVDFARHNWLLSSYVGGLNFQIEHHLFAKISHTWYPALSRIVEQVCKEHGVPYVEQPTLRRALVANVRFLKQLGRKPATAQ